MRSLFYTNLNHTVAMKFIAAIVLIVFSINNLNAATYYSRATGNWNSNNTWSTTSGGAAGSSVPTTGDVVYIEKGNNVTVTASTNCSEIFFTTTTATSLTLNSGITLNVSGTITIPRPGSSYNQIIVGAGYLNAVNVDFTIGGSTNRHQITISTGTVTVSGNVTQSGSTGSATIKFSGAGTLKLGGTFLTASTGTLTTVAGSTVEYNGTAQTIGNFTYSNLTLSGSGAKTLTGSTINQVLSIEGSATTTGSAPTLGSGTTIQYKGNVPQTTGIEFPATFNGTGGVIINNAYGVSLNAAKSISSNLHLISGNVTTTSTNTLTVTNTASSAIFGGSAASYINGPLRWQIAANLISGTYIFPVGKTSYLPYTIVDPITGSTAPILEIEAYNSDAGASAVYDGTLTEISHSEYWKMNVISGNFTNSNLSLGKSTDIAPLDVIAGSTAQNGTYTTLSGTVNTYEVSISNSIDANRYFVLAKGKPTVTLSTNSLSSFTYIEGLGPSAEQSFTVTGTSLTNNLIIEAPTDYEISTGTGASFVPSTSLVLLVSAGKIPTTPVYIRLKAGLPVGNYGTIPLPEIITLKTTGVTDMNINCFGNVIVAPLISTAYSFSPFYYNFSNGGPSAIQSFTVSGTNLYSNITITAPTDYQICLTSGGTYVSSLTLTPTSGNVGNTTIYVRLKSSLVVSLYNENIQLTSTNAVTREIYCLGSVSAPTVNISTFTLAGFIYDFGNGPSGVQSFEVSGQYLTSDITVSLPASAFEISLSPTIGYQTTPITLSQSGGIVDTTLIYVRLKAGLSIGNYDNLNIGSSSNNSITQIVRCSGEVVELSTPSIICSRYSLAGFMYTLGNGPSVEQSFTVSGTALTGDITITPPASNMEISLISGGSFYTTPLSIPQIGGSVNAIPVYVRLKAGLSVAVYPSQDIILSSPSAAPRAVNCADQVIEVPSITASASPNGGAACPNSTINLYSSGNNIVNQYWTGPNSFYSLSANPQLTTNATATLNGNYTVTGSALSGVNLLLNGDFQDGNTNFGTSYTYVSPGTGALYPEGVYTVDGNPRTSHSNFSECPDHTTGSLTTGKQMIINGSPVTGVITWSESTNVSPGATYQFSYYVQSVNPDSPSRLQLYVNSVPAGPIYTAESTTCVWKKFIYNWTADANTTVAQLALINQNTTAGGNDFALDDLEFQQAFPVTSTVNVTVYPTLTPSVSIVASDNPVLSGTTVTFTATPANGGTNPAYQWKVDGINVIDATSSTYSFVPTDEQIVTCVMTPNYPCPSVSNAASSITMIVNPHTNFWLGSVNSDWCNTANWTANYVPLGGNDIEFADGINNNPGPVAQNDLVLDDDRAVGQLINKTTRTLIIPVTKGLTVNNSITTLNNPDQIYIQSSSSEPNGSLVFHNDYSSPVYATVEMYSIATFNLTNPIGSKYKWQFFGIPLRNIVASPTFDGAYVRELRENDSPAHWYQLNNYSNLTSFTGYELTQQYAKKYYFKGILENRDYSVTLPYTSGVSYPGQTLIGNPYTAAIDISKLEFGAQTIASVFLYNTGTYQDWYDAGEGVASDTNSNVSGQYTAIPKENAGKAGLPNEVPSMQAFLVRAKMSDPYATVTIPYSSAATMTKNTEMQRTKVAVKETDSEKVWTKIDVKGSRFSDRMWIFIEPSCSHSFDNGWDGEKFTGSKLSPQIFAMEDDGDYQVNTIDDINNSYIGFLPGEDKEYTMTFTNKNLDILYHSVYLLDLQTDSMTDITGSGTSYTFLTDDSLTFTKRFKIITNAEIIPEDTTLKINAPEIRIFSSDKTIFIDNTTSNEGMFQLFDITGRHILSNHLTASNITTLKTTLIPGTYLISVKTQNYNVSKQLILR